MKLDLKRFRNFTESPEEGLSELRRFYKSDVKLSSNDFITVSIWAAYFGDPELALDTMEQSVKIHATSLHDFWAPLFHETRQLPGFREFVRDIGLVDYWKRYGWPDLCHQTDSGDFECD